MPAFVGPEINDDGIVALYDSANPKSWGLDGSKWKDSSKNSNDGSITGAIHSQGPFPGAGYVSFDGTDDYLTTAYTTSEFRWWDTDYTIEAWIYPTTLTDWYNGSARPALVGNMDHTGNTNYWSFGPYNSSGNISFYSWNGSAQDAMVSTESVTANSWNHIAFIKNSSGCKIFVNGVGTNYMAISGTPQDSTSFNLVVGAYNNADINGYVSNLRIVKGTALYTSNFTPSLIPLTVVPNTKLLTCQGGSIVDASPAGHSITNNGATAVYNDISYFTFDGSSDYVSSNAVLPAGQQQYTISTWWKTSDAIETQVIWEQNVSGTAVQHKRAAMVINNTYCGFSGHSNDALYLVNITANTWINVVMVVDITRQYAIYMYKNGSLDAVANPNNGASNLDVGTGGASIGKTVVTNLLSDGYFNGQISNVTIYNRALTSTEVAKNFNALRGRYGI